MGNPNTNPKAAGDVLTNPKDIVLEKPLIDHREYRYVKLNNKIQAVVVSDAKADKAAACLAVGVGSLHERKDVQGLAHFCEHMLFLGTKKYSFFFFDGNFEFFRQL